MAIALGFVIAAYLVDLNAVLVLAGLLAGMILLARLKPRFDPLKLVSRKSYGELFFVAGMFGTGIVALPDHYTVFAGAALMLALADPLAALVGRRYGTHRYRFFGEERSLEGSLACALVSAAIFLYVGLLPLHALAGGLGIALIEAVTPAGSDNLFIPLAAALLGVLFGP